MIAPLRQIAPAISVSRANQLMIRADVNVARTPTELTALTVYIPSRERTAPSVKCRPVRTAVSSIPARADVHVPLALVALVVKVLAFAYSLQLH